MKRRIVLSALLAAAALTGAMAQGQPVKLTAILLKHPLTKDVAQMEYMTQMAKAAGVTIEWQQISADWDQKKGTLLASGDVPDLFVGINAIVDADFSQFPGLFQPLNDLIAKDAPNVQKMFQEKPVLKALSTQLDGKIYGLPKYQRFWPKTVTRMMINKQWLQKLGLKEPTNFDELYNVLVAFKTKDPNGNGKADEIPMDWAPGLGAFNANNLIASYGIQVVFGSSDGFYVENGKVKNYFTDPRYKELVKFLNKCFAAGLINPEVFTNDYTKFQSVTRNPDAPVVGVTFGWDITDRVGEKWAPQYETFAPMKPSASYKGKVTWDYSYDGLNYGANCIVMTTKCKSKDAAMKFIDQFYNPRNSIQVLFGSIGPNIKENADGSLVVLPPTDKAMDPGTWKWTSALADDGPMYVADSLKVTLGTDMQAIDSISKPFDAILKNVDLKKDVWPGTFIKYSSDDNNQMALLKTNLNSLTSTKWANWIAKGGVDAEWDQYVKDCDNAGLPQLTKIMQKYYDAYIKNLK
jgi:ABC-type sugar transport system, periplasmic component